MTTKDTDEAPEPQSVPAPAPAEPAPAGEPVKDATEPKQSRAGLPLGHILLGGASATTLGGFWLASAVGPWAVAGVGAGAVAAGGAYVHHRMAKRRGRQGQATRTVKTQTSRSGGGALGRMGLGSSRRGGGAGSSGSSSGGRSQRRGASAASGSLGGAGKRGSTAAGAGSARPAGGRGGGSTGRGSTGARPVGGGRGSSGTSGRGLLGRRADGSGSSGRGLLGRRTGGTGSSAPKAGRTSRKGMGRPHSTPPGDGGLGSASGTKRSRSRTGRGRATTTTSPKRGEKGGAMGATTKTSPRSTGGRWGGASGTTSGSKPGRLRAMGRRAAGWADGRTGQRASTAWKAASGARGFRARRRAAREALRNRANHHPAATGAFALVGAVLASLWTWQGRIRQNQQARAQRAMDNVDPDATTHQAHTGPAGAQADDLSQEHIRPYEVVTDPTLPTEYITSRMPASEVPVGGNAMAGLPHAQYAADLNAAATKYSPEDAYRVVDEAGEWPDAIRDFALSIRAYYNRLETERFPLSPASRDTIQELYNAASKIISVAQEIQPSLRRDHEGDMHRRENPRGDESKWNV